MTKTFDDVFSEHFEIYRKNVKLKTENNRLSIYLNHICPFVGSLQVANIKSADLMKVFRNLESKDKTKTSNIAYQIIDQVIDYAIVMEYCLYNTVKPLKRFINSHKSTNRAHYPESRMPVLFTAVRTKGRLFDQAKVAFMLIAYTAVRSIEAVGAKWCEIDFEESLWKIPSSRMKMDREHWVPLSPQVIALLQTWRNKSNPDEVYIFPGHTIKTKDTHMSGWCLSRSITFAGHGGKHTIHGFRHLFSTVAYESNKWRDDPIELSLAHSIGGVRGVYNKAQYIEERRQLMSWYAEKVESWSKNFIVDRKPKSI